MPDDLERSLSDEATFAGRPRPQRAEMSLGHERTLGDGLSGQETIIDDIEVVDLEARYKIEGTLGQGGMGAVLLATDTRLDRKVAIKRILGEAAGNRIAVNRFLTEAKSIAALNHPNIVQIYDYGRAKDGPFLIMEFVDGGSLLDRCRDGAIPLESAVDLACQLCDGLAKAHDLGIIHRDIKPANVLLTKDGTPKLTDFGLAKAQAGDHGQTMTGAVLGTPDFMPPEQRRDASEVDARSDLWSLAATVYQMATGRSPKIIRFDLLPGALTKVLGKALEDAKEDRYQAARELRDALKASLRAATLHSPAIAEGQCPSCGVQNDSSRRFCRGCGGSLEAPCLSCEKPMPIGEEICGSCGAKQTPLLEAKRASMAAEQAKAEGLLGDFLFDEATRVATQLRDEPHSRLSHLKAWAEGFLGEIEESRSHQVERAKESLVEAHKHEEAHDYLSAIFALDSVPDAMRSAVLPGARETVGKALDRLKKTQAEVRRLESYVKQQVASKSLDGLIGEVAKLLELQPDRADLQKLRSQLLERESRQVAAREKAVASAAVLLDTHEYEAAYTMLSALPQSVRSDEVFTLLQRAEALVTQVSRLKALIRDAISAKRFDELLAPIDEYLWLKPADSEVVKLRRSLLAREAKVAADIAARVQQARSLENACRFADSTKVLEAIPLDKRNEETSSSLFRCQMAAASRAAAINALASATVGEFGQSLRSADPYRLILASAGLEDAEFTALYSKAQAGYAVDERQRKLWMRFAACIGSTLTFAILVCGALWLKSSQRAATLATALQKGNWNEALALDPQNVTALVERARVKLSANPSDIEGAFSDLDQANRGGREVATVKTARGDAHAARAREHAQGGKLDEAAKDLAEAQAAPASAEWIGKAKAAIGTAWISLAEEASNRGDLKLLQRFLALAKAGGAADEAIRTLQARNLLLEAVALMDKDQTESAVRKAFEALLIDSAASITAFKQTANGSLRKAVVAQCYARFDKAVAGKDWDTALRVAAPAVELDNTARDRLGEAVARHSGELSTMPAAVLSLVSAKALAALPASTLAALAPLRNSIGIELKWIPSGTFTMGGRSPETPHQVTLTQPFFIGVYEVTNAQWERVMGRIPSKWREGDRPVEQVSWSDAVVFCERLSELPEEKRANRKYRLPTAAEWEYACRAGTTTHWSFGNDESKYGEYAWCRENSGAQTHPVGQKQSNAWGLYDMHGNVAEWCSDWGGDSYPAHSLMDPKGPDWGPYRTVRGGSWQLGAPSCGSAGRFKGDPPNRDDLGFRLALSPSN